MVSKLACACRPTSRPSFLSAFESTLAPIALARTSAFLCLLLFILALLVGLASGFGLVACYACGSGPSRPGRSPWPSAERWW